MRKILKYYLQKIFGILFEYPIIIKGKTIGFSLVKSQKYNVEITNRSKIYPPYYLINVKIGDFTYIGKNCDITNTVIGKFCSIGPNFCCGLGLHPTNGISTSPMFYSTAKQNGFSMTKFNKIAESKHTVIGNDVFIGANVTVIDGVTIGNGAVVGAGAVVARDIPPYAIAVGIPAKVVKFRFKDDQIHKIEQTKWWDFDFEKLGNVEKYFFEIDEFNKRFSK